jgi:C-terminal processing protease CtpA/Prc
VILQDHDTYSAAEDFLVAADGMDHVTTIGRPSNGSTGQPLRVDLPGGGTMQIVTKRDTYPDGRDFVGIGIQPDVFVEVTVDDVVKGRDVQLERSIEILRQELAETAAR